MTKIKTQYNRRSFIKSSAAASGGLLLGFSWFAGCTPTEVESAATVMKAVPKNWFNINTFLKIGETGLVTIISPNPEIGQNVKTSMPMIVAEELGVAWKDVVVEQAPLNDIDFARQVAGGSQSIRQGWESLRMAGATARQLLINTAAKKWNIDPSTCSASKGIVKNTKGEELTYGELAPLAVDMEIPKEVPLKDPKDFTIIGKDTRNVDLNGIISGQPLFGIDTKKEGMLYAVVLRPPAFGQTLNSFDDTATKQVSGIQDVIQFGDKVAVLATSTWAALKGKKALKATWKKDTTLENSTDHDVQLLALFNEKVKEPRRQDGNISKAFKEADEVMERVYEAPFLPHNCMEPMNFYANVTAEKAELIGPIQTPKWTRQRVADLLEMDESTVSIDLTRMGGGFGRRLYGDFALEAAEISKISGKPIQVIFSREDDMTAGTYRPASKYKIRAAIKDGKITGYHLAEAAVNANMFDSIPNNFPAGTVANYQVDNHQLESNITVGAWRAPYTNFLAFAEQSFLDEIAEKLEKDPVQLRLELFEEAKKEIHPEGNYDIDKFVGVIKLAAEKSGWGKTRDGIYQGFSAYYSHNTYVAEVAEVKIVDGNPKITKVTCAVDCGIVINPIAAKNQIEGGIIDGIGHAMYGDMTFKNGVPQASNFNTYRLIRMGETPDIDIHFVNSFNAPTGLGEPTLPPAGGAIANAIHAATGKRMYKQPFVKEVEILG